MCSSTNVEKEIRAKSKLEGFITPFYKKYCLSNVASTVLSLFDINLPGHPPLPPELIKSQVDGCNKVILLLIDAFGFNQFLRVSKDAGLVFNELKNNGVFFPITSTFPSTTTTTLTTVNTGLTPQEHEMLGYIMYLREFGVVGNMIYFNELYPEFKDRKNQLFELGLDPKTFLGVRTVYERLSDQGIASNVITGKYFKNSGLSLMHHKGASFKPYVSSSDMFVRLRKCLELKPAEKSYTFVYWGATDGIAHEYGPYSDEFAAEIRNISYSFRTEFIEKLGREIAKQTLLMVTADHGQAYSPSKNIILTSDHSSLRKKFLIPPTGDSRAAYVYVKPGKLEAVRKYFENSFGDNLVVLDSKEALKDGFFGLGEPREDVYDRIGDLIIVSRSDHGFAHPYSGDKDDFPKTGSHGGLTEDEMLIPFFCVRLSNLVN